MAEFGQQLRQLRLESGYRQSDLVDKLDKVIARSTLASVESGREHPSARLWAALERELPVWAETLRPAYTAAVDARNENIGGSPFTTLAGPFALVEARYVYVFREHPAPEEIIEVRRVRALRDGADAYVLRLDSDGATSDFDAEVMWGGQLTNSVSMHHDGNTTVLHRLEFDRKLRKGDIYSFALRSWVAGEDDPPKCIGLSYTIPISEASLHLNFFGPVPSTIWRFGPVVDSALGEDPKSEWARRGRLEPRRGAVSAYFENPRLNTEYGVAWVW
jgi:transcriptional regulator with XRE-family HTH domain